MRCVERAVRDDLDLRRVDAERVDQAPAAVLGVHDDAVHPLVQPPLGVELAGPRLARQDVVRGQHARVDVGQQAHVDRLHAGATGSARRRRPPAPRGGSASMSGTCCGEPRGAGARRAPATSGRSARRPRSRCHPRRGAMRERPGDERDVRARPASAALSAWSYGGVYAAGSTRWTRTSRHALAR